MKRQTRLAAGGPDRQGTTRERLVRAAMQEFGESGFQGTDSNRIARRAGFAPQTFYRWFADKTAVFMAAYSLWQDDELALLEPLLQQRAPAPALAEAIIAHHRAHRLFRRSLRQLGVENDAVRGARADARKRQIERLLARPATPGRTRGELAVVLLQIERLADALAEREFEDLGFGAAEARATLARLVSQLLPAATA